MKNPVEFDPGSVVASVYTGKRYTVVVPDKKGMATLRNEAGGIEEWNAYNNRHFTRSSIQYDLFAAPSLDV